MKAINGDRGGSIFAIVRSTVNRIGRKDAMVVILNCRASQEQHVDCHEAGTEAGLTRLILRYEYVAMADDENEC